MSSGAAEISSEKNDPNQRRFSLESFNRIYKIPLIGNTINLTSDLYEKVKVSNAAANYLLHSAEQSVHAAVSLAEPVFITFQKPLLVTDSLICNTMDKIARSNAKAKETQLKVTNAIVHLPVQSAINCAKAVSSYSVEKVGHFVSHLQHQQQQSEQEEEDDETIPRETELGKQDQSTQIQSSSVNVREKIEFFSKIF